MAGWLAGWLAGSVMILPLCGPSCKLRLAISSARLNFSNGPSVAKSIIRFVNFRLEHNDKINSSAIKYTYVLPRLLSGITAFLWAAGALFFRMRVRASITEVCPQGQHSAIGGRKRRNIITLGENFEKQ